jgi:membrane-associated phospholipid phosphatase
MVGSFAVAVTDFGDLAVLLPMAAVLTIALWGFESRGAALAWAQALALCVIATLVLKVSFLTCGRAWGLDILSPSGHCSMSTVVYGAFAIVLATQIPRWRSQILLGAALLILGIAASRTALHMHNKAEVAIGLAVGLTAVFVFAWNYRRTAHRKMNVPAVVAGAACVLVALYGMHFPAERFLFKVAHTVHSQSNICRVFSMTDVFASSQAAGR